MPLTTEEKAARARERMIANAKAYKADTYSRRTVAPVFQKMIRAEFAADSRWDVPAVVDDGIRQVRRHVGQCVCVTCGRVARWDSHDMQTGHFVASRRNSILFEETNVAPQCSHCNGYMSGAPLAYLRWMEFVHGREAVDRLRRLKTESRKFGHEELVDMRIAYAARLEAALQHMTKGA